MKDQWTLILNDGSRHDVTADVSFEVVGRQKFAKGTIDGDMGALFDAFKAGGAILESSRGHQHRIAVEHVGGGWRITGIT